MNPETSSQAKESIDIGSPVIDSQGAEVGKVGYVVVRPEDLHMTDIVVNTGSLLGRDVVVPAENVKEIRDRQVYLSIDKNAIGQLPDYVEVHYQQPPADWGPASGLYYPPQAVLWPAGSFYPEPASVKVNAPAGTVGLHKGMDVESLDGHKVGAIESVEEEPSTGNISEMIIRQGVLMPHDTAIPAGLIQRIENDVVTLKLTRDEIEQRLKDKAAAGFRTL